MRQALIVGLSMALLGGCGGRGETPVGMPAAHAEWRAVATARDRDRLRSWRTVWLDALAKVRQAGGGAVLAAEGTLFDPDGFVVDPMPPEGDYRCRVFKLGGKGTRAGDLVVQPPYGCRVDVQGNVHAFHGVGGLQRPVGLIFPDPAGRGVFLGTLMIGDETRTIDYGRDTTRDMAGFVDRIGERRWRIVLPMPAFGSRLDIIEMVPAAR